MSTVFMHSGSSFDFEGMMAHLGLRTGSDFYSYTADAESDEVEWQYRLRKEKRCRVVKQLSIKTVERRQAERNRG
ncbi:hypothetical protein ACSQ5K_26570 [Pseudomonas sp. PhalM4]